MSSTLFTIFSGSLMNDLINKFPLFLENKLIPSELRKDAISLEKKLNWQDEGADGKLMVCVNIK